MTQDVKTRSVRGVVQAAARDVSVMWGWIALLFGGTLVGAWAICRGVNQIFAGFALREVNTQADRPGA